MRRSITAWILCAGIGWADAARAAPANSPSAGYQRAVAAGDSGDLDRALRIIDDELGATPGDLPLLRLKGTVLVELQDLPGAYAAFAAFLAAGATGKDAREVQQTMLQLEPALTTFLDITVDSAEQTGPVEVYLDSAGGRPLCIAAPSCHKAMLPRDYTLIALAGHPGFARWVGQITVDRGKATALRITLAPLPSTLKMTPSPPGAQIELAPVAAVTATSPPTKSLEAKPVPRDAGRSPTTAFLLSFGGAAASWGLVAAAAEQPMRSNAMWTFSAIGAVFGPSLGRWYAHKVGVRGIVLRLLSVTAVAELAIECNWPRINDCGKDVQLAGFASAAAIYLTGTIEDIVLVPDDARNYRQTAPSVTVVPMVRGDRGGLALAGQF